MLDVYLEKANQKIPSVYKPKKDVREALLSVKKCYESAYLLQHKSFRYFNDMSVLERQSTDQKIFNLYEEPEPKDPDLKWRERSRRPLSRNRTISIAAHLISSMMYPNVFAQNDQDEEDVDAGNLMRTMILYNIDNSDYEMSMLFGVIAACVNPCMYLSVDFVEAMQEIREESENGDISIKEVIDTTISGMQIEPIAVEEMFIANIWQYDHQKQPYRIRRQFISYDEAEAKYGDHDDWSQIKPGVQTIWDSNSNQFYRVDETEKDGLVEEVNYQHRRKDLEIPFVNGIYVGKDNVKANRMMHRDADDRPKYPESKTGYEPFDEKKFYYYKSLVAKLWPDQKRLDKMHRLAADGTYLEAFPPVAAIGVNRKIDRSVIFPAAVTQFPRDSSITPLKTTGGLSALYNNMIDAERSMNESSQDSIRGGVTQPGGKTAYEISRVEYNAIIKEFAIFGRMIGSLVESVGEMMVDNIIRYQTVLEPDELFTDNLRLKSRQFLLPNETEEGQNITKKIQFTDELMGEVANQDEKLQLSFGMMEEEEKKGGKIRIMKADPSFVAKLKYRIDIEPDAMTPRSQAFQEDRKLSFRDRMLTSPVADIEAVERDFLFDVAAPGQADKYMKKAEQLGIMPQLPGQSPLQIGQQNVANRSMSAPGVI